MDLGEGHSPVPCPTRAFSVNAMAFRRGRVWVKFIVGISPIIFKNLEEGELDGDAFFFEGVRGGAYLPVAAMGGLQNPGPGLIPLSSRPFKGQV